MDGSMMAIGSDPEDVGHIVGYVGASEWHSASLGQQCSTTTIGGEYSNGICMRNPNPDSVSTPSLLARASVCISNADRHEDSMVVENQELLGKIQAQE
jgi:hypothetical protein